MKKIFKFVGIVVVVLFVIGIFAGSGEESQKVGTTDTSQVTDSKTDDKEESSSYKIGDKIKMGDIILTVNKMEISSGGQYHAPNEGNEWINLNLTIENTGSNQEFVTTMGQMYLLDSDGNQYSIAITDKVMENTNSSLDGAIIAKAKKTGWVGFETSKDITNLTFRYSASFWTEKAILVDLNK